MHEIGVTYIEKRSGEIYQAAFELFARSFLRRPITSRCVYTNSGDEQLSVGPFNSRAPSLDHLGFCLEAISPARPNFGPARWKPLPPVRG